MRLPRFLRTRPKHPSADAQEPGDSRPVRPIHFLHIGKCAGSAIKELSEQINERLGQRRIVVHPHQVRLQDLPPADPYFFSIRDPITRFVSGFESRKRKGRPRYQREWTADEARAFRRFDQAAELAQSLFLPGPSGHEALAAIKSISHTAHGQIDWFAGMGAFLSERPPVWIIRQEHYANDVLRFLTRTGLIALADVALRTGLEQRVHSTDYSSVAPLPAAALENLRRWYVQDLVFYDSCTAWMDRQSPQDLTP